MLLTALAPTARAAGAELPLQLEVSINGQPVQLVGGFADDGGELASSPAELAEIGLVVPDSLRQSPLVRLRDLAGVTYRYDAGAQKVDIAVGDEGRRRHRIDAARRKAPKSESGTGAVLNYALVGTLTDDDLRRVRYDPWSGGGSLAAQLDGWIFTPHGHLESSVILRAGAPSEVEDVIRLDTAWTSENPDALSRWRLGDTITGGLSWTRPVRLGGVQLQRSFDLRPDLVTTPLPTLAGTAVVPSTVDVYINNVKAHSEAIPAGPFSINNLPVMTGAGTARVVVRDAAGRETTSEQSFYSAAQMLAPGLYDFSVEAGFARRSYGTLSDDYDDTPIASATGRYGLHDILTLEAHAEGGDGLLNAGAGIVTPLGRIAVASAAVAFSRHEGRTGAKVSLGLEANIFDLTFAAQSQRTLGDYMDLAAVTSENAAFDPLHGFASWKPVRALDFVSVGVPVKATRGHVNLALVSTEHDDGSRQRIATASYTQRLRDRVSAYATGYRDFADGNAGIFAGLSISFDGGHHASFGAGVDEKGASVTADYTKSSNMTPGSVGWRATVSHGATERIGGQVDWTTEKMRLEAAAYGTDRSSHASMIVTGSIAAAGGSVFAANRIDNSFAVVDAGAPGVEILHENRRVAKTDASGRALVPGLRAHQSNKIAIDPLTLPLDMEAPPAERQVVPASRSGVVVELRGIRIDAAAVVVFRDASGAVLPPGSAGRIEGTADTFVVGYDGEAYMRGLAASNTVVVDVSGRPCTATFAYSAEGRLQGRVEGVVCR